MAKSKNKTESSNFNKTRETMFAVKSMVDFIKDEVDRAVVTMASQGKIETTNQESVSNVIKMTIDNAFMKSSAQVEKSTQ